MMLTLKSSEILGVNEIVSNEKCSGQGQTLRQVTFKGLAKEEYRRQKKWSEGHEKNQTVSDIQENSTSE